MTTVLSVSGMSCSHCVKAVKEALEAVPGVASAEVTLEPGQATVEHEDTATSTTLIAAIVEEGYEVSNG